MSSITKRFSTWAPRLLRSPRAFLITSIVLCVSGCEDQNDSPQSTAVTGIPTPYEFDEFDDPLDHQDEVASEGPEAIKKPEVSTSGPWPKAVAPETRFNFKRLRKDGPDEKHAFTITNEGDAPLELTTGKTTCQCTKFSLDRNAVGPGESATLTVQWQVKQETAAFSHGGNVHTNDPDQTDIAFIVEGSIESSIITRPKRIWSVGNLVGDTPRTLEASLFSRIIPDLMIENMSARTEFTTTEYVPMTDIELKTYDALSGWNFKVTVRPDFPVGALDDTLTVVFKDEKADDAQVAVTATRLGDIRFNPMRGTRFDSAERRISLGHFPAAKGRKAELLLLVDQDTFDEELKFLEVESNPNSLRVSLEPIGKSGGLYSRYRMTVEILPGGMRNLRGKANAGTIRCRSNHPTEKEIFLRVTFNAF